RKMGPRRSSMPSCWRSLSWSALPPSPPWARTPIKHLPPSAMPSGPPASLSVLAEPDALAERFLACASGCAFRTSQRKLHKKPRPSTGAFCLSRIGNWPIIDCHSFVVYPQHWAAIPREWPVNFSSWTNWLILAVGTLVTGLVFAVLYLRWAGLRGMLRRRSGGSAQIVNEEDLPWEGLLELLRRRGRELADSASPPDEDLPPEELLQLLLRRLPTL